MKTNSRLMALAFLVVVLLGFTMIGRSSAMIYDNNDFQLSGKLEAKTGVFTEPAKGNTTPNYQRWQMFKQRNMAVLQADHDLTKLTGMDLQYHLVGRMIYEGVYDYGPKVFREAYDSNKDAFDRYNLKLQYALWEAYVNYKIGALNIRVGRQNLSWGETDMMRVVDHINPIDNTWGGTGTETLDDRRIPLWMLRTTYQQSPNLGFEAFLVPGSIDATVALYAPDGSPYAAPTSDMSKFGVTSAPFYMNLAFNHGKGYIVEPARDMSNSRFGFKVQSSKFFDTNIALTFQRTFWDLPGSRLVVLNSSGNFLPPGTLMTPGNLQYGTIGQELSYPKVNIFGLQANHIFTDLDFILKGEVAHTLHAPILMQASATSITTPLGAPYVGTGQFAFRDRTDFGLSFEKQLAIRAINKNERIQLVLEYYGTYWHNYDNRMRYPMSDRDYGTSAIVLPSVKRYEQVISGSVSSEWHSTWKTSFAALYDPRGAYMLIPGLTYKFAPYSIELQYSRAGGRWVSNGMMQDRDQASILLRLEL